MAIMNTCKTCIYWNSSCAIKNGVSDCDMVDSVIKDKSKTFEIIATADDDSNMNVKLMTGENFGCIHHEPKQ